MVMTMMGMIVMVMDNGGDVVDDGVGVGVMLLLG